MSDFALSPWHMWGSSELCTIPIVGGAGAIVRASTVNQLARVNYGRPDTWGFFFASRLLAAPDGNALQKSSIAVFFDLIIGVGRSSWDTSSGSGTRTGSAVLPVQTFATQAYYWAGPPDPDPHSPNPPIGANLWTTQTRSPIQDPNDLFDPAPVRLPCDSFPAQDIQCSVRVFYSGLASSNPVQLEIASFFAPKTHIRPEWYTDHQGDGPRFRGLEQGGT